MKCPYCKNRQLYYMEYPTIDKYVAFASSVYATVSRSAVWWELMKLRVTGRRFCKCKICGEIFISKPNLF